MSLSWSNEQQPNTEIRYNHVISVTPIGNFTIEWKGWKEYDSKAVYLDGWYLESFHTLGEAKEFAYIYLKDLHSKIGELL